VGSSRLAVGWADQRPPLHRRRTRGELIGAIIVGFICGALASAIVPGKTPGGVIGVLLVGSGGVVGRLLFAGLGFRSA
jgi:uncharacterized membrane protein YeaQ/YmgE (transglycosylase-associated protein family)